MTRSKLSQSKDNFKMAAFVWWMSLLKCTSQLSTLNARSRLAIIRNAYTKMPKRIWWSKQKTTSNDQNKNGYALLAALDFIRFATRKKRLLSSLGKQAQCLHTVFQYQKIWCKGLTFRGPYLSYNKSILLGGSLPIPGVVLCFKYI